MYDEKKLMTGIYIRVAINRINQAGQTLIYKGLSFFRGVHNAARNPISMTKRGL